MYVRYILEVKLKGFIVEGMREGRNQRYHPNLGFITWGWVMSLTEIERWEDQM